MAAALLAAHPRPAGLRPPGLTGLKSPVKAGKDGHFVFTAPSRPGTYDLYSNAESDQKFQGFTGTMTVASATATPTPTP